MRSVGHTGKETGLCLNALPVQFIIYILIYSNYIRKIIQNIFINLTYTSVFFILDIPPPSTPAYPCLHTAVTSRLPQPSRPSQCASVRLPAPLPPPAAGLGQGRGLLRHRLLRLHQQMTRTLIHESEASESLILQATEVSVSDVWADDRLHGRELVVELADVQRSGHARRPGGTQPPLPQGLPVHTPEERVLLQLAGIVLAGAQLGRRHHPSDCQDMAMVSQQVEIVRSPGE